MSAVNIDPPRMGENPDGITRYLYRMVEQLNYALQTVDREVYDVGSSAREANNVAIKLGELTEEEKAAMRDEMLALANELERTAQEIYTYTNTEISQTADAIRTQVASAYVAKGTYVDDDGSTYTLSVKNLISNSVQELADSVTRTFATKTEVTDGVNEAKAYTETYIRESANGIEIGKSDSPYSVELSNSQLSFLNSGVVIAYISGNKLYITSAEVTQELKVGKFLASVLANDDMVIKWVG